MSAGTVQSAAGKAIEGLENLLERLCRQTSARAPTLAGSLVVVVFAGFFGAVLILLALAAVNGESLYWLPEEVRGLVLSTSLRVGLTVDSLMKWGIADVLWKILGKALILALVLVVGLYAARALIRMARIMPWLFHKAARAPEAPRIRLTRPLRVAVRDTAQGCHHQFDMEVDLVLRRSADTNSVIGQLSAIVPAMLGSASEVIDKARGCVSAKDMAHALTRSARKRDKRVRSVELRDLAYAMIDPKSGAVLFTQNLPVVGA